MTGTSDVLRVNAEIALALMYDEVFYSRLAKTFDRGEAGLINIFDKRKVTLNLIDASASHLREIITGRFESEYIPTDALEANNILALLEYAEALHQRGEKDFISHATSSVAAQGLSDVFVEISSGKAYSVDDLLQIKKNYADALDSYERKQLSLDYIGIKPSADALARRVGLFAKGGVDGFTGKAQRRERAPLKPGIIVVDPDSPGGRQSRMESVMRRVDASSFEDVDALKKALSDNAEFKENPYTIIVTWRDFSEDEDPAKYAKEFSHQNQQSYRESGYDINIPKTHAQELTLKSGKKLGIVYTIVSYDAEHIFFEAIDWKKFRGYAVKAAETKRLRHQVRTKAVVQLDVHMSTLGSKIEALIAGEISLNNVSTLELMAMHELAEAYMETTRDYSEEICKITATFSALLYSRERATQGNSTDNQEFFKTYQAYLQQYQTMELLWVEYKQLEPIVSVFNASLRLEPLER